MGKIHGTSALKPDERYTIEDWQKWPEGERWELIEGAPYAMSPSPRTAHQGAAYDLGRNLGNFLEGKPCTPFMAPLDVFFEESEERSGTVVQPDVIVVCDRSKIGEDGIHGAPDFVAEVLSDATANKDLGVKKSLYERAGVREYWIVHPDTGSVYRFTRTANAALFDPVVEFRRGERAESVAFPGFSWTFPE